MRYAVHVQQDWVYLIDAADPDEAAQSFSDDPPDRGDCTGYNIEAVTHPDDTFAENDLRAPIHCRGCGKDMPAASYGECQKCLLVRINALASVASAGSAQQPATDLEENQ